MNMGMTYIYIHTCIYMYIFDHEDYTSISEHDISGAEMAARHLEKHRCSGI